MYDVPMKETILSIKVLNYTDSECNNIAFDDCINLINKLLKVNYSKNRLEMKK